MDNGAARHARFFAASVELMQVLARARAHHDLQNFSRHDLSTWRKDMAELTGVSFAGDSEG